MHSTPTSSPAQKRSLLRHRNFVLLWIAQAISLMGDVIFDLTLVIWIAADLAQGMTWAPLAVSGVLLAAALPVALVGPLAGVFVDRWDKRRTMLWMDFFRVVLILSLLLITGIIPLPWLTEGNISLPIQLGVLFLVLARMTNLAFAMGLIVLLGICQAAVSVVVGPLLLKFTPRELVGRVSAVLNPSATLASLIAITLAGYLASTVLADLNTTVLGIPFGPIDTIFTGAGLLVVLAGLYMFSALRVTTPETTVHSEVSEAKEPVME